MELEEGCKDSEVSVRLRCKHVKRFWMTGQGVSLPDPGPGEFLRTLDIELGL